MVKMLKKTKATRRDMFKWTERMDDVFVDALIRQERLGNRIDNVFTTAAYDNMVRELRERIGMPFEKDHLKNRLKTLKNNFKECLDAFNGMNGFTWSPETKMWNAKPEAWKAFVKARPEGKKWMTSQISHYDKLFSLFSKHKSKSNGVNIATEKAGRWPSCESPFLFDAINLQNDFTLNMEVLDDTNGGTSQLASPVEANSPADSQTRSQCATSLKGKKRKAASNDAVEREFKSIREAIKDVAEAIREGNRIAEHGRPHVYSEGEVFAELVNIGVETHLRYKAYMFLVETAARVRAFFGCPTQERKDFLMQLMYNPEES